MNLIIKKSPIWFSLIIACSGTGMAQESLTFTLKTDIQKANAYFKKEEFTNAVSLYVGVSKKEKNAKNIALQIARCYYYLNEYQPCTQWYERYLETNELPAEDVIKFAEAWQALHNYKEAIKWYTVYHTINPENDLIMNKIWRLKNIKYLYEDSIFYSLNFLPINSKSGDLCPVLMGEDLVFMSNREPYTFFNRTDSKTNSPFYKLYHTRLKNGAAIGNTVYDRPKRFGKELKARYHQGPVSFYDGNSKMIYSAVPHRKTASSTNGGLHQQLYFAEKKKNKWSTVHPFAHNEAEVSFTQPAMSDDGNTLYFTSDKAGGYGKRDIYKSDYVNNQWTTPVNLGEKINTPEDESFAFVHQQTLYFSSDGHPGFGGLDIFKVAIEINKFTEVQNLGYPVNSGHDDFAITLTDDGTGGYLTSNRKSGGLDDDIYELHIRLQTFPVAFKAILKYKFSNETESSNLKLLANARIFIIDTNTNAVVQSTNSTDQGEATITIPHFSQYKMHVVETDGNETTVSLDIAKERRIEHVHEIVIIKNSFKSKQKQ